MNDCVRAVSKMSIYLRCQRDYLMVLIYDEFDMYLCLILFAINLYLKNTLGYKKMVNNITVKKNGSYSIFFWHFIALRVVYW